jgi:hypothetical protein
LDTLTVALGEFELGQDLCTVLPTRRSRAWLKLKNPASTAMLRVWEDRL